MRGFVPEQYLAQLGIPACELILQHGLRKKFPSEPAIFLPVPRDCVDEWLHGGRTGL